MCHILFVHAQKYTTTSDYKLTDLLLTTSVIIVENIEVVWFSHTFLCLSGCMTEHFETIFKVRDVKIKKRVMQLWTEN